MDGVGELVLDALGCFVLDGAGDRGRGGVRGTLALLVGETVGNIGGHVEVVFVLSVVVFELVLRMKATNSSRFMFTYTFKTTAANATCRLVVPPHRAVIVDMMTVDGEMRDAKKRKS